MNIEFTSREGLDQETVKELRSRIKALNQEREGFSIAVSGKKDDLVDRILEDQRINLDVKTGAADTGQRLVDVMLDQLQEHPDNERHEIDYYDPQLMNSLNQTGQFMSVPRVVDSGSKTSDGRVIYNILAGNRSVTTFKRWSEEKGKDLSKVELTALVREYKGSERQKRAQELMEISLDNATHKAQSPIEKARIFKKLQEEVGMTQAAIAQKEGIYGSQVSATMKYLLLPDRVQELIHYGYDSARYARWPVFELERFNVPFKKAEDGEVTIEGISLSNAKVMLSKYLRRNDPDFEQSCLDLNAFFMREDILRYAKSLPTANFETALENKLKVVAAEESWTWYKDAAQELAEISEVTEEEPSKAAEASAEAAEEGSDSEHRVTVSKLDDRNSIEAAKDLRSGAVILADNWLDKFVEAVEMEEIGMLNAFKTLFYHEILVYSESE